MPRNSQRSLVEFTSASHPDPVTATTTATTATTIASTNDAINSMNDPQIATNWTITEYPNETRRVGIETTPPHSSSASFTYPINRRQSSFANASNSTNEPSSFTSRPRPNRPMIQAIHEDGFTNFFTTFIQHRPTESTTNPNGPRARINPNVGNAIDIGQLQNYNDTLTNVGSFAGFQAIPIATSTRQGFVTQPIASTGGNRNVSLRNKIVYQLDCSYCGLQVCRRAMKAILLADTKIELYSTDIPPAQYTKCQQCIRQFSCSSHLMYRLRLLEEDRMTQGCNCRIRDTACFNCGNVLGYHVSQPCERCLDSKNNGHFWMFYADTTRSSERMDPSKIGKPMYWGSLTPVGDSGGSTDRNASSLAFAYELFCR